MNLHNPTTKRAYFQGMCVVGVLGPNDDLLDSRTAEKVNFGEFARQAHAKFGPCRVLFKEQGMLTWREVRWKNKNIGTMYRRPSAVVLDEKQVPDLLKLMDMIV